MLQKVEILGIKHINQNNNVFDIEVKDAHCYFADDILVHNCDGVRCHITKDIDGTMTALSRSGKEFHIPNALLKLNDFISVGEILDGELLVCDSNGIILDRKTGNGIINKASKNTITLDEESSLRFVVWDIVDESDTVPYSVRLRTLENKKNVPDNVTIIETYTVNCEDDAIAFGDKMIKSGQEGAIIKNINHLWKPKRSKDIGKIKAVETCDLVVLDVIEGTGKYSGGLGALVCQTSDGLLSVNVGSGFSDKERGLPMSDWIGKIVEVKYNETISSKSKDTKSLFLPRFSHVRTDKLVANCLGNLK